MIQICKVVSLVQKQQFIISISTHNVKIRAKQHYKILFLLREKYLKKIQNRKLYSLSLFYLVVGDLAVLLNLIVVYVMRISEKWRISLVKKGSEVFHCLPGCD